MRWREQGRQDILKHVSIDSARPDSLAGVFTAESCPFLKRDEQGESYLCMIHDTKPYYCKVYPDDGVCEHVEQEA